MIGIASIGIGTTKTVQNMLKTLDLKSEIVSDPMNLEKYSHLILPGVGHFTEGSSKLDANGWRDALLNFTRNKPILGICLGMQLLGHSSGEGEGLGLNLLNFKVEKIASSKSYREIHMGWNKVDWVDGRLSPENERFYFVHGYFVRGRHEFTSGTSLYGAEFTSAIRFENIWGYQFHPEKSHKYGFDAIREFTKA